MKLIILEKEIAHSEKKGLYSKVHKSNMKV